MQPHRKIASNLLLHRGKFLCNPIVEVAEDGTILSVTTDENSEAIDRMAGTEHYSGVMIAGMINAHCHLELSYLHGKIAEGGGFAAFASEIGKIRSLASEEERLLAIERADAQMQREGIVAVADIVNGASSFATKRGSSIEYRNFAELFGLNTKDISSVESLLSYENTSLTLHSTYSLNSEIFRSVAQQNLNMPLSVHFMESQDEQNLYNGCGSLHDWYDRMGFKCDFLHHGSPAQRIVDSVPAERPIMLIHCCMVQQKDIDTIMGHFTAPVYWVLSPRSNDYISRIQPPVELLRRNGLNICVGSDSLASNHSLSVIEELKMFQDVPLAERLDWATRQGAAALGLSHLGEISIGKRPKISILSGIDYSTMQFTDSSRIKSIVF